MSNQESTHNTQTDFIQLHPITSISIKKKPPIIIKNINLNYQAPQVAPDPAISLPQQLLAKLFKHHRYSTSKNNARKNSQTGDKSVNIRKSFDENNFDKLPSNMEECYDNSKYESDFKKKVIRSKSPKLQMPLYNYKRYRKSEGQSMFMLPASPNNRIESNGKNNKFNLINENQAQVSHLSIMKTHQNKILAKLLRRKKKHMKDEGASPMALNEFDKVTVNEIVNSRSPKQLPPLPRMLTQDADYHTSKYKIIKADLSFKKKSVEQNKYECHLKQLERKFESNHPILGLYEKNVLLIGKTGLMDNNIEPLKRFKFKSKYNTDGNRSDV